MDVHSTRRGDRAAVTYMILTTVAINVFFTVLLFHVLTNESEEDPYDE